MSSDIMLRDAAAPTSSDSDLLLRQENTINTPVNSVSWLANGEAISDVYTVTATSSTSVNVTADDTKNEHVATGIAVVADDATINDHVVPGVGIVFSSSLANGWESKISIGALMAIGGSTSDRLNTGIIEAGSISTQRRLVAFNVGSESSASTEIYALPGFFIGGSGVEDFVTTVQNHTETSRHALATEDELTVTFGDYQSGTPDTADVYVDIGAGAVKAIEDAKLDGSELYQYGEGNGYIDAQDMFKGLGIIFSDNGDPTAKTFIIYVRNGYSWVEYALDVTGSPGTWQSPPLTLTESGQTSGVITAGAYAHLWYRVNVPISATPGDRKLFVNRVRGLTV